MRKTKTIWALLLLLVMVDSANATVARVRFLSKEESNMLIQDLQKIVIEEDVDQNVKLSIYDLVGVLLSEQEINSSAKITFEEESVNVATALEEIDASSTLSFYPNPATDYIHISGLQGNELVRLFNLQGQVVIAQSGADVNISSLASGTYILLVGKQCFKVIIE